MTVDEIEYDHRFDPPTEENLRKLELSREETAGLVCRDIKCPICGYVVSNRDGEPLSYTQFKRLWHHVVVRIAKPRLARKKVNGKYINYMLYPELGAKARNNGYVTYCLDFDVTPHQLRHTYITNLIAAGVDPKTVQYLAGHENSRITMDIYAKVKYNRPNDLIGALTDTFDQWDSNPQHA